MSEDAQRFSQHEDDEATFEPIPPTAASYAFARRYLADDERFMAHIIHERQQQRGLTDEDIAHELRLSPDQLARLSLYQRPRPSPSLQFQEDVKRISEAFNLDAAALTRIVREHDTFRAFQGVAADASLLAAARDRDTSPEEEDESDESPEDSSPRPPQDPEL
jgi:hypothetical protein